MSDLRYTDEFSKVLEKISQTQAGNIKAAAKLCADAIGSGKMVHLYGSGHSVIPVQDLFPRYGGLVGFHPCLDSRLMWNNVLGPGGTQELIWIERQEGYAKIFLNSYNFQVGEVMIVYSHGGLNAAPVEAAMLAKEHGLKVVAVTCGENYKKAQATHSTGKKLGDLADVLIDNCCPLEDSLVAVPGYHEKISGSSTIAATIIAQAISAETGLLLAEMGHTLYTFVSPNVTEVPASHSDKVYEEYRKLVMRNQNNI